MSITIPDRLWGEIAITELVLQELVGSEPVQRLHGIHQAGASYYLLPEQRSNTRFEHSIGVMHLLSALGASLEEQVAGLLHDVPHTAFSHTVDIVFPNDEHNFHERFQHEIVMRSAIPQILSRHGVSLHAALEPDEFPLLERTLPDLCADRVDYALRDVAALGKIDSSDAIDFLSHLVATPDGIVVNSVDAAFWFANLFKFANEKLWTGAQEAGAYWALAGAIKRAYEIGLFTDADLFSTDNAAMHKLSQREDPLITAYLNLLAPGTRYYAVGETGDHFTTRMKQRVVDPLVLKPGAATHERLSALSPEYGDAFATSTYGKNNIYRLWSDSIDATLASHLRASRA